MKTKKRGTHQASVSMRDLPFGYYLTCIDLYKCKDLLKVTQVLHRGCENFHLGWFIYHNHQLLYSIKAWLHGQNFEVKCEITRQLFLNYEQSSRIINVRNSKEIGEIFRISPRKSAYKWSSTATWLSFTEVSDCTFICSMLTNEWVYILSILHLW